jgi:hypothetical protein
MKFNKVLSITIILSLVAVIFVSSSGLVSAFDSSNAYVVIDLSAGSIYPDGSTSARIDFHNTVSESLQIQRVAIHFSWMENNTVAGQDLSSNPLTIQGGGSYLFGPITVTAPTNIAAGDYTYYVTVDGIEQVNGAPFTWNSPVSHIHVYASYEDMLNGVVGATPTPTATTTSGGDEGTFQSWLLIVAVVVVVAIVAAVLLLFMEMRKKPKAAPTAPAVESPKPADENPKPEPAADTPKPAADEPVKNIEQ